MAKNRFLQGKRGIILTVIFVTFVVMLVASLTIAHFYSKKNKLGRVNVTLVYGTYNDLDGFVSEIPGENSEHTTVKSVRIGTLASLNYNDFDRMGHDIIGWYLDSELKTPFEKGTTIKTDLTLYAEWDKHAYSIKFYRNATGATDDVNHVVWGEDITVRYADTVQVKENGEYVNGFVNPFLEANLGIGTQNGLRDYQMKTGHYFNGWGEKIEGEENLDTSIYENEESFKMPARDMNFVVNWAPFKVKVVLVDNDLTSSNVNSHLTSKVVKEGEEYTGLKTGYYVNNIPNPDSKDNKQKLTEPFNVGTEIKYSEVLNTGFYETKIEAIDGQNYSTKKFDGWYANIINKKNNGNTNYEKFYINGKNEKGEYENYIISYDHGEVVNPRDSESGAIKINERYFEIKLYANWIEDTATINFYTGVQTSGGERNLSKEFNCDSFADITDIKSKVGTKSKLSLIGWALPNKLNAQEGKFSDYSGYSTNDTNYFIETQEYKVLDSVNLIDINKLNHNSATYVQIGNRGYTGEDIVKNTEIIFGDTNNYVNSNKPQVTINLYAIWGYTIQYGEVNELTPSRPNILQTTISPVVKYGENGYFEVEAKILNPQNLEGNTAYKTMIGWSASSMGDIIYDTNKINTYTNQSPKNTILYAIWIKGNGSKDHPFIIENLYDWNRVFNSLENGECKSYLDGNGKEVFINEDLYLDNKENTTLTRVINENCYIKQTKDFDISHINGELERFEGVFVGNFISEANSGNKKYSNKYINYNQAKTETLFYSVGLNKAYKKLQDGTFEQVEAKTAKIEGLTIIATNAGSNSQGESNKMSIPLLTKNGRNVYLKDCFFEVAIDKTVESSTSSIKALGGVIEQSISTIFENCTVAGNIITRFGTLESNGNLIDSGNTQNIGGFIGIGSAEFINCVSKVDIQVQTEEKTDKEEHSNKSVHVGGFIGRANYVGGSLTLDSTQDNYREVTFENCSSSGEIFINLNNSTISVGGFVGTGIVHLKGNNVNSKEINVDYDLIEDEKLTNVNRTIKIGGIAGDANYIDFAYEKATDKTENNASLILNRESNQSYTSSGDNFVGGIAGDLRFGYKSLLEQNQKETVYLLEKFYNRGIFNVDVDVNKPRNNTKVDFTSTLIGGLFGRILSNMKEENENTISTLYKNIVILENCNNYANLKVKDNEIYLGGLIGATSSKAIGINNSNNSGGIEAILTGANSQNSDGRSKLTLGGLLGIVSGEVYIGYDYENYDWIKNETYKSSNSGGITLNQVDNSNNIVYRQYVGGALGISGNNKLNYSLETNNDYSPTVKIHNFTNNSNIIDNLIYHSVNDAVTGGVVGVAGPITIEDTINNGYIKVKRSDTKRAVRLTVAGIIGIITRYNDLTETGQDTSILTNVTNYGGIEINTNPIYKWTDSQISGIVGFARRNLQLENVHNISKNKSSITVRSDLYGDNYNKNYYLRVAGLVARAIADVVNMNKVSNSQNININFDYVNTHFRVAGIIASAVCQLNIQKIDDNSIIDNYGAKNYGEIKIENANAVINNNFTGTHCVGGIVGQLESKTSIKDITYDVISTIKDSSNCNVVSGTKNLDQNISILNFYTNTDVNVGGIIGKADTMIDIVDCFNENSIIVQNNKSAKDNCVLNLRLGGIAGSIFQGSITHTGEKVMETNTGKINVFARSENKSFEENNSIKSLIVGGIVGIATRITMKNVSCKVASTEKNYVPSIQFNYIDYKYADQLWIGGLVGQLYFDYINLETVYNNHDDSLKITDNCEAIFDNCDTTSIYFRGLGKIRIAGAIGQVIAHNISTRDSYLKLIMTNINKNATSVSKTRNIKAEFVDPKQTVFETPNFYVGGMIGRLDERVQVYFGDEKFESTVINDMDITVTNEITGKTNRLYLGGILGNLYYDNDTYIRYTPEFYNCINYGNITGQSSRVYNGGLIGYISNAKIINCRNFGSQYDNVEDKCGGNVYMGGIIGCAVGNIEMQLTSSGAPNSDIIMKTAARTSIKAGGLIGCLNGRANIEDCFVNINTFEIDERLNALRINIGGLVGYYENYNYNLLRIYYTYANASVTRHKEKSPDEKIGGLIGRIHYVNGKNYNSILNDDSFNIDNSQFKLYNDSFSYDIGNIEPEQVTDLLGQTKSKTIYGVDEINLSGYATNIWKNDLTIELNDANVAIDDTTKNKVITITYINGSLSESTNYELRKESLITKTLDSITDNKNNSTKIFLGWAEYENASPNNVKYKYEDSFYPTKNLTLYPVYYKKDITESKIVGNGTKENPYIINDVDDWNNILVPNAYTVIADEEENGRIKTGDEIVSEEIGQIYNNQNYQSRRIKYFQLGADIEFNSDAKQIIKFNGVLDGNGKTITFDEDTTNPIPFVEMNGMVKNLEIKVANVKTYYELYSVTENYYSKAGTYISGLAVYLNGGILSDIIISGELNAFFTNSSGNVVETSKVGSLASVVYSGAIINCTSTVEILTSGTEVGGLVGAASRSIRGLQLNKGGLYKCVSLSPVQPLYNGTLSQNYRSNQEVNPLIKEKEDDINEKILKLNNATTQESIDAINKEIEQLREELKKLIDEETKEELSDFSLVIENSYFNGKFTLKNTPEYLGGLLGYNALRSLFINIETEENSEDFVNITQLGHKTGGFVGTSTNGELRFENCTYKNVNRSDGTDNVLTSTYNGNESYYYGNYVGRTKEGDTTVSFINCKNYANIKTEPNVTENSKNEAYVYLGGFIGLGSALRFYNCESTTTFVNENKVTAVGGFVGMSKRGGLQIEKSIYNPAQTSQSVINAEYFGGLCGYTKADSVSSNIFNGLEYVDYDNLIRDSKVIITNIKGSANFFGGYIGYAGADFEVINSENSDLEVQIKTAENGIKTNMFGGLIGLVYSVNVDNADIMLGDTSIELIGSNACMGGVIGRLKTLTSSTIKNCDVLTAGGSIIIKNTNTLNASIGGIIGARTFNVDAEITESISSVDSSTLLSSSANTDVYAINIENCRFNIPIESNIVNYITIGGLIGKVEYFKINVKNCIIDLNSPNLSIKGGIIGYFLNEINNQNFYSINCENVDIKINNLLTFKSGDDNPLPWIGSIAGWIEDSRKDELLNFKNISVYCQQTTNIEDYVYYIWIGNNASKDLNSKDNNVIDKLYYNDSNFNINKVFIV